MLINSGADTETVNAAGLTPHDLAVSLDLHDIEELFPVEVVECLPTSAGQYTSYEDLVPVIFPDHKM